VGGWPKFLQAGESRFAEFLESRLAGLSEAYLLSCLKGCSETRYPSARIPGTKTFISTKNELSKFSTSIRAHFVKNILTQKLARVYCAC
jgi:hypothetical protein